MSDDALRAALLRVVESWALDDTCLRNEVERFLDDVMAAITTQRLATILPATDTE